jgi:hypothetical protein
VAYAAAASDRAAGLLAALGGTGVAILALGAMARVPEAVPAGIVLVAAEYAVFLAVRGDAVDAAAPLVAGALVLAGELAYSALEPPLAPAPAVLRVWRALRSVVTVAGAALVAALVLLAAVAGVGSGTAFQLLGIVAAVAAAGLLALLARGRA